MRDSDPGTWHPHEAHHSLHVVDDGSYVRLRSLGLPWSCPETAITRSAPSQRNATASAGRDISGRLNFHWRTVLLPPSVIEYVVVHELVHLLEPHHTAKFWSRLERALPDFAQRRQWLVDHPAAAALEPAGGRIAGEVDARLR